MCHLLEIHFDVQFWDIPLITMSRHHAGLHAHSAFGVSCWRNRVGADWPGGHWWSGGRCHTWSEASNFMVQLPCMGWSYSRLCLWFLCAFCVWTEPYIYIPGWNHSNKGRCTCCFFICWGVPDRASRKFFTTVYLRPSGGSSYASVSQKILSATACRYMILWCANLMAEFDLSDDEHMFLGSDLFATFFSSGWWFFFECSIFCRYVYNIHLTRSGGDEDWWAGLQQWRSLCCKAVAFWARRQHKSFGVGTPCTAVPLMLLQTWPLQRSGPSTMYGLNCTNWAT